MSTEKTPERIVRMKELSALVGYAPSTLYELVARGKFPAPFKLIPGGRAAGWRQSEIFQWIDSRASSQEAV